MQNHQEINTLLETNRLRLREFNTEDGLNLYLLNRDPEVLKYTGDKPFKDHGEAGQFLLNYDHYKKYGFGRWAVIHKKDGAFMGWCGLKYTAALNEYDLGFRFLKKYWNQGFATEASLACIKFGFEQLHLKEIVGRAMVQNQASVKVLEKVNMTFNRYFDFEGSEGVIYKIKSTEY